MKENVQLIFFYIADCVAPSRNISMFFKERAAASEKIFRKNDCFRNLFKRKNVLPKDINIKRKCAAAS